MDMECLNPGGWRNDARAKVTGDAKYTDDLKFDRMLHAVPVYSDFVHARILGIRKEKAESQPGVRRILTARDVPGCNQWGQIIRDLHILADDKIRYHGDVIALVVADTREQALHAAQFVQLDAEELPAVLDPVEALKPGAPLVHEHHGSNLIHEHKVRTGDLKKGFRESEIFVEQTFRTPWVEHAYLEPESAIAVPRDDGVMVIYGSMQHPFSTRRFVAAFLGVSLSEVEVIAPPMGGGFGGKDDTAAIVCARAALAAKLTGRPVKITYSREWSFRESYKRHPYIVHYKMGLTRDGFIKAVQCTVYADGGAYCSVTPWVTWRSTVQCCGPYVVEHVHADIYGVYTNNVFTGAMRGFGSPQMNFVIEQVVEMAAEKCGLSPIEFRRKNMVKQGSVTITGQKLDNHKVAMGEVLDKAIQATEFETKLLRCSKGLSDQDELYGIGLAMSYRGVSLGAEGVDFCAAIINVQADGSVLLETGIHENGQGSETAMCLILSRELGISLDRIRYRRPSTSNIPDSGTTVASRGTIMGGGAVATAARELKNKISHFAMTRLSCSNPQELEFRDNRIYCNSNHAYLEWTEVIREMYSKKEYPYALGVFRSPQTSWNEENGQGKAYFTWVYGCQVAELTVNKKTGKVRLLSMTAVHDVGRAINPVMVLGQFYGGMAMGAGYALFEDLKSENGKIRTLNFNTYRIPRSTDLPEMHGIIVENYDPVSLTGAKSIGEPTNEIMAPAIANAVYNAIGQRYFQLPIKIQPQN